MEAPDTYSTLHGRHDSARMRGSILRRTLAAILLVLLLPSRGLQAATTGTNHVSQFESPLGCVNTIITESVKPTGPSMADGGGMNFRDDIAPGHGIKGAEIRYLYVPTGSYPVGAASEPVRVCLLNMPKKQGGRYGCDPSKDIRGREFLVYVLTNDPNRQSNNAAVYTNGEHYCGGA
jgi:hypothetical protein